MRIFALCIISLLVVITLTDLTYAKPYENYTDFLSDIKSVSIDYTNAYPVREYFITKDVANISLDSGVVYLCKPVNGRICMAVFIGTGTLMYEPPIKVEQDQLERYLKTRSLNAKFSSMLLFCGDSTVNEIINFNIPVKAEHSKNADKMIENFVKYEISRSKNAFNGFISRTLLEDEYNEVFYSYFDMDDYEDLFFCIDPYEEEEVSLWRGDWYAAVGIYNESVNEFHFTDEYQDVEFVDTLKRTKEEIKIEKYTIDCTIEENLKMKCNTKIDMVALKSSTIWFRYYLYDDLNVSSVKSSDGKDLKFYKPENYSGLWVKMPQGLKINDTFSINIEYSGEILKRYQDYVVLKTSIGWYPNHGFSKHTLFDLTYHVPESYEFVSIGDLISEAKNDGIRTSHWLTPYKCRNASFNLGLFNRKEYDVEAGSPVEILYHTTDQWKAVAEDVQLSMSFFTKLFGSLPIKKFYATELPAYHGEAFPGLIHLSTFTFIDQDKSGRWESFRSHEIAHQWWGISVDMKSYRDRWLSEGFAQYVSLIYTQMILKDNQKFFDFLIRARTELLENRKSFLGSGFPEGPIALGHRLNSMKTQGDYNLIIYQKGAWILHMLRNICLDLNTMREDLFLKIMKEFYDTYKGKKASTRDFQKIVENNTGLEYGWFFDQWVYDTKIPKYIIASKYQKTPDGNYQIRIRVKQENVPPTFKMFIPIGIYGSNKQVARVRTFITNEVCEFDLPPVSFEPEKIKFNDLESVLCDYEDEDWD